ncbi:MAG: DUF3592 domain-containing protein, partial [Planctomycetales bacterium]|nr:DUF3592 domain-containing protein [Planctomycetales bacterium]
MRRRQSGGPLGGLILGALFAVIGYFVAFTFGKPILDNANASRDWPSAPGVITRSEVATARSNGKTMYSFDVVYRYSVDGREFTSSNVFFGGNGSSSHSTGAHKVAARYPRGGKVDVYYDPSEPANAVLEPGAHWQSYAVFGAGLIFLVVGALAAGTSLFWLLAAGAVIGGAVASALGGSSGRTTARKGTAPNLPLQDRARP